MAHARGAVTRSAFIQRRAYKVKAWETHEDFLEQLAVASGKLTRGGEPDLNTAAKMVLIDWQKGKLPFFSTPPGYDAAPPRREEALAAQAAAPSAAVTVRVHHSRSSLSCTLHWPQASSSLGPAPQAVEE